MPLYRFALALLVSVIVADVTTLAQTPRLDPAGDPLPEGVLARIGTTRFRIRGGFQSEAFFSIDGKSIVTKCEQGVVSFWDAETGKATGQFKDADFSYDWSADLSPDGKFLAVYGLDRRGMPRPDSTLRLYDLATRKPLWTQVDSERFYSGEHRVRFTSDGRHIVTAARDIRVWDAKSGQVVKRHLQSNFNGVLELAPDGKTLAFSYTDLYLWDWETDAEPRKIATGLRSGIQSAVFAPSSKVLHLIGRGNPRSIDVATGKLVGSIEVGPTGRWLKFSPDGKTYAVGFYNTGQRDGFVVLRDAETGKEIRRLASGADLVNSGVWSRDGSKFAGVAYYRMWVWDVKTGKSVGPSVQAHDGYINGLVYCADGRLFSASDDHTIRAWEPTTGKQLLRLELDHWARGMDVSTSGALIAGNALGNDFRVWDGKTGEQIFKLHGHGRMGGLRRVRFSNDEQTLLSFGDDGYLRKWDTPTGKLKAEHRFRSSSGKAALNDGDDDEEERMGFGFANRGIELGPDGNTLVLNRGKEVSVIAADTGKERFKFEADPQRIDLLTLSADGKKLATIGPGEAGKIGGHVLTIWDMTEAKELVRFNVPPANMSGVLAFTPDGKMVMTGAAKPVVPFWNAANGNLVGNVELPDRPGRVAVSGDGKQLAVAFADTTVLVYDLAKSLKPATKG